MPTHSSLDLLEPSFGQALASAMAQMEADPFIIAAGVTKILPRETLRDIEVQFAYYCSGRMIDPADVVAMYAKVVGYKPSLADASKKITWTLDSKHIQGKAADIAPSKDGRTPWWSATRDVLGRMGEIAKANGLAWGGDWAAQGKDDPFHFEAAR